MSLFLMCSLRPAPRVKAQWVGAKDEENTSCSLSDHCISPCYSFSISVFNGHKDSSHGNRQALSYLYIYIYLQALSEHVILDKRRQITLLFFFFFFLKLFITVDEDVKIRTAKPKPNSGKRFLLSTWKEPATQFKDNMRKVPSAPNPIGNRHPPSKP
ncbi:hypothetical protein SCA6_000340 [Theobroma cacao]